MSPLNFDAIDEGNTLYRLSYSIYVDEEKVDVVDWIFAASEEEIALYALSVVNTLNVEYRPANLNELAAYKEGRLDGVMMGMFEAKSASWNGVAIRLAEDVVDFDGSYISEKIFTCGNCKKVFDFMDAAMVGNFFAATTTEDNHTLWHLCKDCAR